MLKLLTIIILYEFIPLANVPKMIWSRCQNAYSDIID